MDLGASRDAALDQELGPVLVPRQRALGRFRDRLQDRGLGFDLREQRDERFSLEAVLLADAGDEGVDVGAPWIEGLRRRRRGLRSTERKRERNREGAADASAVRQGMCDMIEHSSTGVVEYLSIAHGETLEELSSLVPGTPVLLSLAVRFGTTRLIDNITFTL